MSVKGVYRRGEPESSKFMQQLAAMNFSLSGAAAILGSGGIKALTVSTKLPLYRQKRQKGTT